jgi:hypothetical protein
VTAPIDLATVPGAPGLNSPDLATLAQFVEGDDRVSSPHHAVELLCILKTLVANSGVTHFPSAPADCFCGAVDKTEPGSFLNDGDELRFIIRATAHALVEAGRDAS